MSSSIGLQFDKMKMLTEDLFISFNQIVVIKILDKRPVSSMYWSMLRYETEKDVSVAVWLPLEI